MPVLGTEPNETFAQATVLSPGVLTTGRQWLDDGGVGATFPDTTLGFFTDTLDFSGHAGVSGIDDLTIEQSGLNTVISDGEGNSITLTLTLKGSVTEADFVF